jgi:acid stress-induced BolA-like protein IbaG/YrbA
MLSEKRLHEVLEQVKGATEIFSGREGSKLIAVVVSPAFEGKEEHERQNEVWGLLLDNLTDAEQVQVSFVFTNTPEEKAQAEQRAAAGGE